MIPMPKVAEDELERRSAAWTPPPPRYDRGYGYMFSKHIEQADKGSTSCGRSSARP